MAQISISYVRLSPGPTQAGAALGAIEEILAGSGILDVPVGAPLTGGRAVVTPPSWPEPRASGFSSLVHALIACNAGAVFMHAHPAEDVSAARNLLLQAGGGSVLASLREPLRLTFADQAEQLSAPPSGTEVAFNGAPVVWGSSLVTFGA